MSERYLPTSGGRRLDKTTEFENPPIKETEELPEDKVNAASEDVVVINEVVTTLDYKNSEAKIKAQRFADAIVSGMKPGQAADKVGTTLRAIKSSKEMQRVVEETIRTGHLSAEIRRLLVRSGLNQLLIQSLGSDDLQEREFSLKVIKQISLDPEVSTEQVQGGVTIDLGELKDVVTNISLPNIAPFSPQTEENKGVISDETQDTSNL